MNEWFDDFKTAVAFLTRLPMPHPDGAIPANFVRAHRMFPVVGALIGARGGLAVSRPAIHRRARSCCRSTGARRQRHHDRRAARGWPGRRRRRIRRRPQSRIEAGDHARQPARHLWRHDPAGELCREAVGARSDPGRLCRAEPDCRARAGARHLAGDVAEPALCAQGWLGPQRRPARCGDGGDRRRAGAADRAVVAVMEQRVLRCSAGGLERASASRGWRCGRSAARPATCSAAPSRWPRPRSLSCSPHGWRSHERSDKPLADPPCAGRRTARGDSRTRRAGRSRRCRSLCRAQGKIAGRRICGVQSGASHAGDGREAGSRCGRTGRLPRTGFWRVDRTASQRTRTRTRRRPIANSGNRPPATDRPAAKVLSTRSRAPAPGSRLFPQARRSSSCIPAPSAPCSPSRSILPPSRRCVS